MAGGIAGTFNAPIGGVAFAIELILPEFTILRIMPLVISATVSTYISTSILGTEPAFSIPSYTLISPYEFIFYIILGFFAGLIAITYIKTLYGMEDYFDSLKINPYLKAGIGGLLIGSAGYILYKTIGNYYIFGVGYSFITDALNNHYGSLLFVLFLLILKILANSLTLAAGGSGGVFAPSLFIGIALGTAVGITVHTFFPSITAPVSAYALVGMAAVVAGTTGAALTSIIMTFEMTRNYDIMLPLMLSVVIASFITRFFYRETIYTAKLSRRGVSIQVDKLVNIFRLTQVKEVVETGIIFVKPGMSVEDSLSVMVFHNLRAIPVIECNKCLGFIEFREIYTEDEHDKVEKYIRRVDIEIDCNEDTVEALRKMENNQIGFLVVKERGEIIGVATRKNIIKKYFEKRELLLD